MPLSIATNGITGTRKRGYASGPDTSTKYAIRTHGTNTAARRLPRPLAATTIPRSAAEYTTQSCSAAILPETSRSRFG